MTESIRCSRCDREFDKIVKIGVSNFICWCSECEHTYVVAICDCGSDPIEMLFEMLMEVKE